MQLKASRNSMILEMRTMQKTNNELSVKVTELEAILETERSKETKHADQFKRKLQKYESENSSLQRRIKESYDIVEQLDFEKAKLKQELEFHIDQFEADKQSMEAELDYRFEQV